MCYRVWAEGRHRGEHHKRCLSRTCLLSSRSYQTQVPRQILMENAPGIISNNLIQATAHNLLWGLFYSGCEQRNTPRVAAFLLPVAGFRCTSLVSKGSRGSSSALQKTQPETQISLHMAFGVLCRMHAWRMGYCMGAGTCIPVRIRHAQTAILSAPLFGLIP
jgi:hypothetical protein